MLALKETAGSAARPEKEQVARQGCTASVLSDLKTGRLDGGTDNSSTRRRLGVLTERLERLRALGGEYARVCFSPDIARRIS